MNVFRSDGMVSPRDQPADLSILKAVQECVARNGFEAVRMDEIARAVGISRATLYRHFGSKEDILDALLRWRAIPFIEGAQKIASGGGTVAERIEEVLHLAVEEIPRQAWLARELEKGPSAKVLAILDRSDAQTAKYTLLPLLEEAREQGVLRPVLDLSELVSWIFRQLLAISVSGLPMTQKQVRIRAFIMPVLISPKVDRSDSSALLAKRVGALEVLLEKLLEQCGGRLHNSMNETSLIDVSSCQIDGAQFPGEDIADRQNLP
jgi:AcrR family transcriptional regulator